MYLCESYSILNHQVNEKKRELISPREQWKRSQVSVSYSHRFDTSLYCPRRTRPRGSGLQWTSKTRPTLGLVIQVRYNLISRVVDLTKVML